jgi:hypothetical protein
LPQPPVNRNDAEAARFPE